MNYEKGFQLLERNLIDNIKEQQAKLGYRKECIYLYYPLSSLQHFFHKNYSATEMDEVLSHFPADVTAHLGDLEISRIKDRFCFKIPERGSQYVHEHIAENEFINALIQEVAKPHCTIETIIQLFRSYSQEIEVKEMDHGEFDYRICFRNNTEDPYYYCFHDEGCHMIYHRFTPEDYADFAL